MKPCKGCGEITVNSEDPPRYDVLRTDIDLETIDSNEIGPYCETCFNTTTTGQILVDAAKETVNDNLPVIGVVQEDGKLLEVDGKAGNSKGS